MTRTRTPRPRLLATLLATGLVAAGLIAIPSTAAFAAGLVVTDSVDDSAAVDGSLRHAVSVATSGQTITFSGVGLLELASQVVLPAGVTIDGGGAVTIGRTTGSGTFDQFLLQPTAAGQSYEFENITITGGVAPDAGGGISSPSAATNPVNITLHAVTIDDETSTTDGAGFFSDGATGTVSIEESEFSQNANGNPGAPPFPDGAGAAIFNTGGAVTVVDSTFDSNTNTGSASTGGGLAVLHPGGTLTVSGDEFSNNTSQSGAGLYVETSNLVTMTGTDFDTNTASNSAGGALISGSTVQISNCSFENNSTTGNRGGALNVTGDSLAIDGTSFETNHAGLIGGAIGGLGLPLTTTISNSTFVGNDATDNGGAIGETDVGGASIDISTSTFSGNFTDNAGGGAIYIGTQASAGKIAIHRSTLSGNHMTSVGESGSSILIPTLNGTFVMEDSTINDDATATSNGVFAVVLGSVVSDVDLSNDTIVGPGGVHVDVRSSGNVNVENSIVTSNSAGLGSLDVAFSALPGPTFAVRYSILSDAVKASIDDIAGNQFSVTAAALKLGALTNNGGSTETLLPANDSPAHDAGDPAVTLPGVFDQRGAGFPRVQGRLDIGAVEIQTAVLPAAALPATGVPIIGGLLLALLLLLAGAGAVLRRRRLIA